MLRCHCTDQANRWSSLLVLPLEKDQLSRHVIPSVNGPDNKFIHKVWLVLGGFIFYRGWRVSPHRVNVIKPFQAWIYDTYLQKVQGVSDARRHGASHTTMIPTRFVGRGVDWHDFTRNSTSPGQTKKIFSEICVWKTFASLQERNTFWKIWNFHPSIPENTTRDLLRQWWYLWPHPLSLFQGLSD